MIKHIEFGMPNGNNDLNVIEEFPLIANIHKDDGHWLGFILDGIGIEDNTFLWTVNVKNKISLCNS